METVFLVVGGLFAFFIILLVPWIGYVVEKYWGWCYDKQKRMRP